VSEKTCPRCRSEDVFDCLTGPCDRQDNKPVAYHCGACGHTWPKERETVQAEAPADLLKSIKATVRREHWQRFVQRFKQHFWSIASIIIVIYLVAGATAGLVALWRLFR